MNSARAAAPDSFVALTGRAPEGVWAAPGRVNLIGEHTDYNDGLVLPFAITADTQVAAARRPDGILRVTSLQRPGDVVEQPVADLRPGSVHDWSAYVLGVAWALRRLDRRIGGADLVLDGQVPPGSGLSSSASVCCSAAIALADLYGLELTGEALARAAQRAENDFVGAPTGPMDQRASVLCTEGHALLLDTRDMSTTQVPLEPERAGLGLLLVDSRVRHEHSTGAYGDRRRACAQACVELGVPALRDLSMDELDDALTRLSDDVLRRRVRHVVTEDERTRTVVVALGSGDWTAVGNALTRSHMSMRDDFEITCPELDLLVETALDSDAWGARMTGGGFGGCAVVLAPQADLDGVAESVEAAFAREHYLEPTSFVVTPSAGARRLQ